MIHFRELISRLNHCTVPFFCLIRSGGRAKQDIRGKGMQNNHSVINVILPVEAELLADFKEFCADLHGGDIRLGLTALMRQAIGGDNPKPKQKAKKRASRRLRNKSAVSKR